MIDRKKFLNEVNKIVVKIGTSSITKKNCDSTKENCSIDPDFMENIAAQIFELRKSGKEVIVVSSGAIGVGLYELGISPKPREIPIRQAAAAVGQSILMQYWSEAFAKYGIKVAQILLTYDFYSDRISYLNLRNSISTLLEYGVVPIINENDCTCTNEIEAIFGDNDKLSAMVASKIDADLLIILSDIDGLFDKNPKTHSDAKLISLVEKITPEIESYGGNPTSFKGVGGMRTKIKAAKICSMAGCYVLITNSEIDNVLLRALSGEEIGTFFLAERHIRKNRARWIILAKASGTIRVDAGAKAAILGKNSLLPAGVIEVEGNFDRGDIVRLECEGRVFAKGITDYSSEELNKIKGAHTDEIESILGYSNYSNVIKKENIGILEELN
ncbi:glutamate 5-kinase [Methanosarcina thermophila]|uniref:Glutamate 5-kinase n=3 Tax=Methanosarcina thermophila TaxID=2210 RepID=A0A1I6XB56_METTE|nr:glutamate 5-kinase [Methanosarcina thermophila]ALK04538.1 MAG: glutamate 5-kinase [Methanosarcina sp. 795]AKB13195.1 Glutamate 5-kinase [Methanosarcina thermophila TM-1]AKB16170.1 Glutamate 5-kinase [Methanosarcina thermophila CHTI-55]NLU57157.1 glutamate 5-kinase [Methanosarcina thermophila]SFT35589.1 glutamate 5-kinase [Methanosarcina thermophila]